MTPRNVRSINFKKVNMLNLILKVGKPYLLPRVAGESKFTKLTYSQKKELTHINWKS